MLKRLALILKQKDKKMEKYNYKKLMEHEPTVYGEMTNSQGQKIQFVEHPRLGDMSPVICVCHELELAQDSEFWETCDMEETGGDYEPIFENGELIHGE